MQSDTDARRVLLAVLVYNGREFVPRCLESAQRVAKNTPGTDVLVLDDCSPEPGWSDELAEISGSLGLSYYRSPRNVGIPRNMNLGLLRALSAGYDHVVLLNSDVILPANLVTVLTLVAEANDGVASVTAWSNNCSVYSIPNADPDRLLSDEDLVDWISECLGGEFGPAGVKVPAAVGFCMLIPRSAIEQVGLFDPVFGRGYCEELDWCLRAQALHLQNLLAPSVFVYHQGGGSTREAGLLSTGETTVAAHERIIDWRYPLFRQQVDAFLSSDIPHRMKRDGVRRIAICAAEAFGYDVEASSITRGEADPLRVRVVVPPDDSGQPVSVHYRGFHAEIALPANRPILSGLEDVFGAPPRRVVLYGRAHQTGRLASEAAARGLEVAATIGYPENLGPLR